MGILKKFVHKPQDIYTEQSISYASSPDRRKKDYTRLKSLNDGQSRRKADPNGGGPGGMVGHQEGFLKQDTL